MHFVGLNQRIGDFFPSSWVVSVTDWVESNVLLLWIRSYLQEFFKSIETDVYWCIKLRYSILVVKSINALLGSIQNILIVPAINTVLAQELLQSFVFGLENVILEHGILKLCFKCLNADRLELIVNDELRLYVKFAVFRLRFDLHISTDLFQLINL